MMDRKTISDALRGIDEKYITEAMEYSGTHDVCAPGRSEIMSANMKEKTIKRVIAIAAAVCLVLAMCFTAYASNLWGIREMLGRHGHELPSGAEEYIEPRGETAEAGSISARIIESLCTEDNIILTVDVTCGDDSILVPADCDESDPVVNIDREGSGTVGEYAKNAGKDLLAVSMWVDSADKDIGVDSAELDFNCVSDNEMIIYVKTWKSVSARSLDLVCTVYPTRRNIESGKVTDEEPVKIPFTATEGRIRELGIYEPSDANAVPGMILGEATVSETPLGLSITMYAEVTDDNAFYSTLFKVEGVDFLGGFVHDHDNIWRANWTEGKGEIGDSFTVHVSDVETGEPVCDIEFSK